MGESYQYEELPESGYIRVMTLYPASGLDDAIQCDLEIAPLDMFSNYAALSYSWGMDKDGDVTLSRTIIMSGKPLAITQNLFEGLRRIRDQAVSKRIWIDAVCINQDDVAERSAQVAQMAKVYSCATHTIIWLGEGELERQDEEIAYLAHRKIEDDMMSNINRQVTMLHSDGQPFKLFKALKGLESLSYATGAGRTGFRSGVSAIIAQHGRYDRARDMCAVISTASRFFTRRYWERRWIVQELYHSTLNTGEVRWGPCVFQGLKNLQFSALWWIVGRGNYLNSPHEDVTSYEEDLSFFSFVTRDQFEQHLHATRAIDLIRDISTLRHDSRFKKHLHPWSDGGGILGDALNRFRATKCADDRDRLYALLSMDPDCDIKRDYSMSTSQIFTLFATSLIQRGQFTSLLMCLASEELEPGVTRLQGLPSWVPDLRSRLLPFHRRYDRLRPDVRATVSSDNFLICEFYCIGSVERAKNGIDTASLQIVHPTGHLHEYMLGGLRQNMLRPRHKDLLCSLIFESWNDFMKISLRSIRLFVLREQSFTYEGRNVYQLITYGWESSIEMDPTWPRITVCIA